MPLPLTRKKDPLTELYRQWTILQKQWGAKTTRLVVSTKRSDYGLGQYRPKTDEIYLFLPALRDYAKMQAKKGINPMRELPSIAASVMRHELAHRQALKKSEESMLHNEDFREINKRLSGWGRVPLSNIIDVPSLLPRELTSKGGT